MEPLEFFEQVRAVLAKMNLAVPGQWKCHYGKNRKGQGDSEGLGIRVTMAGRHLI